MLTPGEEIANRIVHLDAIRAQQGLPTSVDAQPAQPDRAASYSQLSDPNVVPRKRRSRPYGKGQQLVSLCDREPDKYRRGQQADCKTFPHVEP